MALKDDLTKDVAVTFRSIWDARDGTVVPSDDSLRLGNDAVRLEATVLYADLADSTNLVDTRSASFAAEVYKSFLNCAARIIRQEGGWVTAYDGDRVMAIYIGKAKNTSAIRTAFKIHGAVLHIINPALALQYSAESYRLKHVVGIDSGILFAARTGVRGANDIVWVGRAAIYAAKLATLPETYPTYITSEVYANMHNNVKAWTDGQNMWEAARWNSFDDRIIYRSNWWWNVDLVR
jgi:class 3 adenylate cyclase